MASERRSLSVAAAGNAAANEPSGGRPDPAASPYASLLGELERAELAARERRLAAESEADAIRTGAADSVAEIEAALPARIAAALAESRARHEAAADAEIAALDARPSRGTGTGAGAEALPEATIGRAAELLMAAVLGERPG